MAEIINLNRVRKARAKSEAEINAANNRVRFGRTRAEKEADRLEAERRKKELDGKKQDE